MGEIRLDPLTGDWSLVAPARGRRPQGAPSRGEPGCPFCPGNESMTPPAIQTIPPQGPWQVRVIPNLYPAVSPGTGSNPGGADEETAPDSLSPVDGGSDPAGRAPSDPDPTPGGEGTRLFQHHPGRGRHEVVVETPEHHWHPADMEPHHWTRVLEAWRDRLREFARDPHIRYASLFRNHGRAAGASQPHPHSQLIALAHVPPLPKRRWLRATEHYARHGRCLLCQVAAAEKAAGHRLVASVPPFTVFCPFAPAFPYELWIVPDRHAGSFHEADDEELAALAPVLIRVFAAMRTEFGDPPHNLMVHGGALNGSGSPGWHWYIQIAPRTSTLAGFELGTGTPIVPAAPETAARRWREAFWEGNRHPSAKDDGKGKG